MPRKIIHVGTYKYKKGFGESSKKPSLTVPGEAYTIQDLLERANRGIPIETSVKIQPGHFASDADFDTFAPDPDFQFVDIDNLARESAETISEAKEALTKNKEAKIESKGTPTIDEVTQDDTKPPEKKKEP